MQMSVSKPMMSDRIDLMKLADALERFNRKERNLLVWYALGHSADATLPLCEVFRQRVAAKINENLRSKGCIDRIEIPEIEIPRDAWWATDFHFSWLAGALALFVQGDPDVSKRYDNPEKWFNDPERHSRRPVEGNQEDIDLVIATGRDLILIEAKAYGWFSNAQMRSKVERLILLHDYYEGLQPPRNRTIRFYLLLLSPRKPKQLTQDWPTWACTGGEPAWIELTVNTSDALAVTRCGKDKKSSKTGQFWRLVKLSRDPDLSKPTDISPEDVD